MTRIAASLVVFVAMGSPLAPAQTRPQRSAPARRAEAPVILQGVVLKAQCPIEIIDAQKKQFSPTRLHFKVGTRLNYSTAGGTRIFSTTFPRGTDKIVIQDPTSSKRFFLGSTRCLFAQDKPAPRSTPVAAASTSTSVAPARVATPSLFSFDVGLSMQTYKSETRVYFPSGESSILNTQTVGFLPELSLRWRNDSWEWGSSLGGFIASAEIGRSLAEMQSSELSGFNYQADNVKIFGGEVSPFFLYRPSFKNVAVGLKLPLRYTLSPWPIPAPNHRVEPQSSFSVSYLLETRLERDSITWIQNVGFYRKWGTLLWSLGASYRF